LASMVGGPMLVGCDRTVEDQKQVKQSTNGQTETQEKKVTQSPDGTMTTTMDRHTGNNTNGNNP